MWECKLNKQTFSSMTKTVCVHAYICIYSGFYFLYVLLGKVSFLGVEQLGEKLAGKPLVSQAVE